MKHINLERLIGQIVRIKGNLHGYGILTNYRFEYESGRCIEEATVRFWNGEHGELPAKEIHRAINPIVLVAWRIKFRKWFRLKT